MAGRRSTGAHSWRGNSTYGSTYGGTWGSAPWDSNTWSRFESNAGKKVSIVHWGAGPPWEHDFDYWRSTFNLVQNAGELSLVGMFTGTVPLRDIANGNYDSSITDLDAESSGLGAPVLPAAESGDERHVGVVLAGHEWQHGRRLRQRLAPLPRPRPAAGATNITWVWCPNVDPANMYTPYSQLYPGDAYVDWTGFNGFNRDGKTSFTWLFGSSYSKLLQLAPTKPIMISEIASEETLGNKASWITDAFSTQLPTELPTDQGSRLVQLAHVSELQVVELADRVQHRCAAGVRDGHWSPPTTCPAAGSATSHCSRRSPLPRRTGRLGNSVAGAPVDLPTWLSTAAALRTQRSSGPPNCPATVRPHECRATCWSVLGVSVDAISGPPRPWSSREHSRGGPADHELPRQRLDLPAAEAGEAVGGVQGQLDVGGEGRLRRARGLDRPVVAALVPLLEPEEALIFGK